MIIRNATLLSFHDLSRRSGVDLRIAGGRVIEIGAGLSDPGSGRGSTAGEQPDELIEASGLYVIPGLVNLHAHTAMTLLRGAAEDVNEERWFNDYVWIYERNLKPEDVYVGTLLGAAEMLLSGVTYVADHYFYMDRAFEAYRKAGMRADLSWVVFGNGEDWWGELEQSLEFVHEYRDKDPRINASLGPHSPYICPPFFSGPRG
ncbi:MAG: amidohydrolase family protein [Spirochaetaceae bacterium]|nr:MAG: amidohydrolase family protein [Spirochaetaceae bacterium]